MNQRPQCKTWNTENARRKHKQCPTWCGGLEGLFKEGSICLGIETNNWQVLFLKLKIIYTAKKKKTNQRSLQNASLPATHLAGEYIHDIQRVEKANGPIKKWAMDLKQRALKIRNKMARKYLLKSVQRI